MTNYHPFAARAGMELIKNSDADPSITNALDALHKIGFDPASLTSLSKNVRILGSLTPNGLDEVRRILLNVKAVYYKRLGSTNRAFIKRETMQNWLAKQGPNRLAQSLKTLSVLSQSKTYYYWRNRAI